MAALIPPMLWRVSAAWLSLSASLCLICLGSCQADLNARSSPLTSGGSQAGQALVFGHYRGLYRLGAGGGDGAFDLYAEDCGAEMWGEITSPNGQTLELKGGRDGSTLSFAFSGEEFSGSLFGRIETARVLSGVWSTAQGQGGTWVAVYLDGSVEDYPCGAAEDYLNALR